MAKALTAKSLENVKPKNKRQEIPDGLLPGLYLVVQPSGAQSWAIRYRHAAKPRKMTLGPLAPKLDGPEPTPVLGAPLTLVGARAIARDQLQIVAAGRDPAIEKRAAEKAAAEPTRDSVADMVADWLKRDQAGNRTADEVKKTFDREVIPTWGERPIREISRRDCLELVECVADRGAVTAARRLHAYLHRMFRWAVGRGVIDASPMADLPKPGRENPRERVLSEDELAAIWRGASKLGKPFGPAIRLLILTAGRKSEIGKLTWPEVDMSAAVIRLEGDRTKTSEPRTVPLSDAALKIVATLPRIEPAKGVPPYVFTTTGRSPVSGWGRAKTNLDRETGALPAWRLHDLRRTAATGLQRLGFRLEVIESVLGHVSGSRAGIVGVYQRHAFEPEKREALDAWSRYVTLIGRRHVWAKVRAHLDASDVAEGERQAARRERDREFCRLITAGGKAWRSYVIGIARGVEAENVVKMERIAEGT